MLRALYAGASGMIAQQTTVDVTANNMANVNTTGFKKARVEFQDLLYAQIRPPFNTEVAPVSIGQGSRLGSINRIFTGGALNQTGNPYDVAIHGAGFFRVGRPDGSVAYTRDGAFRLDADGFLTTAAGHFVLGPDNERIQIPEWAVSPEILPDGTVQYFDPAFEIDENNPLRPYIAGSISLAIFTNQAGMLAEGENLWLQTEQSGAPVVLLPGDPDTGRLVGGHLEASNVNVVEEMVNLITAQRAYEINSKAIQSADEMMQLANNLRRG